MDNSRRAARLKSFSITHKHLRGRHDQRDHAWNRGMGKGGGYMPAALSPQQFQDMKTDFRAKVASGEMTQEVADATLKRIREIYNADYDANIASQLSRRNVTTSILANKRTISRYENKTPVNSSAFLMSNVEKMKLANREGYNGSEFSTHYGRIGQTKLSSLSDDEMKSADYLVKLVDNELVDVLRRTNTGRETLNHYMDMMQSFSRLLDSIPVQRGMITANEYLMMVPGFENSSTANLSVYDLMRQMQNYLHSFKNTFDPPSAFFGYMQSNIKNMRKHLLKASEIDWDAKGSDREKIKEKLLNEPNGEALWGFVSNHFDKVDRPESHYSYEPVGSRINEVLQDGLDRLEILEYLAHPDALSTLYDVHSSKSTFDMADALSQNIAPHRGREDFYTQMGGMLALDAVLRNPTPENIKSYFSTDAVLRSTDSALNNNESFVNVDRDIAQQMFDNIQQNSGFSLPMLERWRDNFGVELGFATQESFMIPVIDQRNPDRTTYLSQNSFYTMGTELYKGLSSRIQALNLSPGTLTDQDKEKVSNAYKQFFSQIYQSTQGLNLTEAQFNEMFTKILLLPNNLSRQGMTGEELAVLHEELAANGINKEMAAQNAERLRVLGGNLRAQSISNQAQNSPRDERLQIYIDEYNRALQRNDAYYAERIAEIIDDHNWEMYRESNRHWLPFADQEQVINERLNQPFVSQKKKKQIQEELQLIQNRRREELRRSRSYILDNLPVSTDDGPSLTANFVKSALYEMQADNIPADAVKTDIMNVLKKAVNNGWYINEALKLASDVFGTDIEFDQLKNTLNQKYEQIRREAWGDKTPVLITKNSVINPGDSTFESDAFAFGNEISTKYNRVDPIGPDDPEDTPFFNQKFNRMGVAHVLAGRPRYADSIFDFSNDNPDDLIDGLTNIGYSDTEVNDIMNLLNTNLLPCIADDIIVDTYINADDDSVEFSMSWERDAQDFESRGETKITFYPNREESSIYTHVGYTRIPLFAEMTDDEQDAYDAMTPEEQAAYPRRRSAAAGSAGPVLMNMADGLRAIAYQLGTTDAILHANAVNIDGKGEGGASGPSTWPALGGNTRVNVTGKLLGVLAQMGYTEEFLSSIQAQGTIDSHLLFLNSPPSIFVTSGADATPKKIKSTPSDLWQYLYDMKTLPPSFEVELNLAATNDPGRLYNRMLPGSRRKQLQSLKELRRTLHFLKKRDI